MSEPYSMSKEQICKEINELTYKQTGKLFKGALKYVQDKGYIYGGDPEFDDETLRYLWPFVKYHLDLELIEN